MSSAEIASMSGAFQQQIMVQNQYSGMVSQQAGMSRGESMMGSFTNRGAGIGSAVLGGGMALAGMDPMSLAMKGGMAGYGAGGMMGAAAGATAAFLPAYATYKAAEFVGSTVMNGMGQQQQLNAGLRQNFGFAGQTGRGFSMSEMGSIGGMVRQQTETRGMGGEFATFEEVSRLAANMPKMGLGQGVRSAKEFAEKFKEMMTTVKDIATTFSTSLEQAQQVMVGMKQSGIFNNQAKVAQMVRQTAVGGNMATSEVTGMMTIGSQMSRMLGGRGASGAMGGMSTIGQIGTSMQNGSLSEEQLYNLTGLEGAEGRRALATQTMQQSMSFLQGGRGRVMLAALAGKDGQLDDNAVKRLMAGGNMAAMAQEGIARSGGAISFLKNQGKLRGEALGKFGGLADVIGMRGIMQQHGFDIENPNERTNLFMQRQMGLSAEEADFKAQQMRDLPMIMSQQKEAGMLDDKMRGIERYRSGVGAAGIKKSIEGFKHGVTSSLEKVGAELYQDGSNMLERWVNKLTGEYTQFIERDVGKAALASLESSTNGSAQATLRSFGLGGYKTAAFAGKGNASILGVGQSSLQLSGDDRTRYEEAGYYMGNSLGNQKDGGAFWAKRADSLAKAVAFGKDKLLGPGGLDKESQLFMQNEMAFGNFKGEQGLDILANSIATRGTDQLKGIAEGMDFDRGAGSVGTYNEDGTVSHTHSAAMRAESLGELARAGGVGDALVARTATPTARSIMWQSGGARTEADMMKAVGSYALRDRQKSSVVGLTEKDAAVYKGLATDDAARAAGYGQYATTDVSTEVGIEHAGTFASLQDAQLQVVQAVKDGTLTADSAAGLAMHITNEGAALKERLATQDKVRMKWLRERGGSVANELAGQESAVGKAIMSEEGGKLALAVTGQDREVLASTMDSLRAELGGNKDMEKGRKEMMRQMLAVGTLNMITGGEDRELTADEEKALGQQTGNMTSSEVRGMAEVAVSRGSERRNQALQEVWKVNQEVGSSTLSDLRSGGAVTRDASGLSDSARKRMKEAGITGGASISALSKVSGQSVGELYLESMRKEAESQAKLIQGAAVGSEGAKLNEGYMSQIQQERSFRESTRAGLDDANLRKLNAAVGASGGDPSAGLGDESMRKRMARAGLGNGGNAKQRMQQLSNMLGMGNMSAEELGKGDDEQAMQNALVNKMKLSGEDSAGARKNLGEAMAAIKAGDMGAASQSLQGVDQAKNKGKAEAAAANDPIVGAIKTAIAALGKTTLKPGDTILATITNPKEVGKI